MNRNTIVVSIVLTCAVALGILYWIRPASGPGAPASSSRLYTLSIPNEPGSRAFLESVAAAGFTAVPNADLNSLLPPEYRKPEFESLPVYRRAEVPASGVRLLGYRPGDMFAPLYTQMSGSRERVEEFKRETEVIQAQLGK